MIKKSYIDINVAIIEVVGGYGGMQYYNLGLASGLSNHLNSVHLFSSFIDINIKLNNNVIIQNQFNKTWGIKNPFLRFIRYFFNFIFVMYKIKKKNCNIVHIHQFHFSFLYFLNIILLKILGIKIILTLHDVESFDTNKKKGSIFLEKKINSLINHFIVHNNYSFGILSKKINPTSISIIKHGNYIPFVKQIEKEYYTDKLTILFFGQIKKVKGLDIFLKALIHLKERNTHFNVLIAGRTWRDDFSFYQNIIDENKLHDCIKLDLRFIPDEELYSIFEVSDLVILPYRSIYQSGVLLKSMSYGRAVLCSDLPPFKEIISDGLNGFLFESENPEKLADKLNFIISNKHLLEKVGKSGYDYVTKNYDWNQIGLETSNLYERVFFS
jgi:D-inositol-3-phosphate glycosyltransferase